MLSRENEYLRANVNQVPTLLILITVSVQLLSVYEIVLKILVTAAALRVPI